MSSKTIVTVEEVREARQDVVQAKAELDEARRVMIAAEQKLADAEQLFDTFSKVCRLTVCDVCGDESNSEPDLQCGRRSGSNPPCPGVYRRP